MLLSPRHVSFASNEKGLTSSACSALIFTHVTCLSPDIIRSAPLGWTEFHSSSDRPSRRTQWTWPEPTILFPQLGVCFSSILLSHMKACFSVRHHVEGDLLLTVSVLPATAKMCGVTGLTLNEYRSTPCGARNSGSGHSERHRWGRLRSCCRTVPSSETVMNKNGEFSVAILFVRSL
jgi:hypothetical protein